MELYAILLVVLAFIVVAFLLGLRDRVIARKRLIQKLNNEYGKEPQRNYKTKDREHINVFPLRSITRANDLPVVWGEDIIMYA